MGKPSAPEPPDPYETAQAQAGANVDTAIANSMLNNVNQITPYGTGTYTIVDQYQMPYGSDAQGATSAADSNIPASTASNASDGGSNSIYSGTIPQWQYEWQLSEPQQAILDESQNTMLGLAQAGTMATNNLQGALANPVDLNNLPTGGTYDPSMQPELMQFDFNQMPELMQFDFNQMPQLQTNFITNQGPGASGNVGTVSNINPILSMGSVSGGGGGGGSVSYNRSDLGPIKSEFGNTQQGIQYGFDDASPINMDSGAQSIMDLLNGLNIDYTPSGEFGEIQNTYNGDFSEDRQRVEDALMQRMDPYLSRDREALESRLASQGLRYGAEAYQDAFGDFNRQSNDARLGAILNAGQEQSRLVGMERDRAQLFNSAQNQAAQQMLAREGLDLQGQIANGNLQLGAATAENSAGMQNAMYGLQAQQQEYNQLRDRAGFANEAQNQDFGQQFTRGQFFNDAQGQGAGQTLEQDRMDLQAQTSNQSSGNAAAGRALQAELANQQARLQEARFGLDAQNQQYNQALGAGQFYNNATQQGFGNYMAGLGAYNGTEQQDFLNYQAGLGTYNNTEQQGFQNYLTGNAAMDDDRSQALQEQFAVTNNAVNQATALMGATQVADPGFQPTGNYPIANTDYAGIIGDNFDAQMQGFQAQQSGWNNMWNAAGTLGSAAITAGVFSDRRLKRDIKKIKGGVLPTYEYRYVWDAPGTVRRGYMAQDALKVAPWAVLKVGKWLALDYAQLPEVS